MTQPRSNNSDENTRLEAQLFRALTENINEGFYALDHEWQFIYLNQYFEEVTGRSRGELIGKVIWDEFPAVVGTAFEEHYRQAAREQTPVIFEDFYPPLEGWVEVRVYPSPAGLSIYFLNISERKIAEIELRDSFSKLTQQSRMFEATLAAITDFIYFFDRHGRFIFANQSLLNLLGITHQEIVGKNFFDLNYPPDLAQRLQEQIEQVLTTKEIVISETSFLSPTNVEGYYEYILTPALSADGSVEFIAGSTRNVTERRRAEMNIAFLSELQADLVCLLSAEDILNAAGARLSAHLKLAHCLFIEIDETASQAAVFYDYHAPDAPNLAGAYQLDEFQTAEEREQLAAGKTVVTNDVRDEPRSAAAAAGFEALGIRSLITAPYVSGGRWKFALTVQHQHSYQWRTDEIELLNELTARIFLRLERARAEQAVRESEARFRSMADHAPVMIWVTEPDGTCTYLSQSWYNFTGQTPETGLGFGWVSATHPDDQELVHETFVAANEKHESFVCEYRLIGKNGDCRWAIDSAHPRFNEAGEFLGYIGSVIDITERKQAEIALRERARIDNLYGDIGNALVQSENLPNLLKSCVESLVKHLDAAFARVWTLNEAENVLELRASAGIYTHLDGSHARVPVGKFKIGLIAEERQPHFTNEVYTDSRVSDPLWAKNNGLQAFAGYPLIVEDRLVGVICLFSKQKLSALTLEALESISKGIANAIERKRIEEERQQLLMSEREARLTAENANHLKDEFLATLSHELRTPLNAILGWSKLLQSGSFAAAETQKALATIERSARSQNQLIDDLLDVSRIITGKLRLDVRAVDLAGVITAAVDAGRPAAEAKNIRLQTLLDPSAGPISGDPDRLQQVIWNLLSNAIKFTPKDGRVQVRLERVNSHVEIVVSDTGKGIEPEFLARVFDRFSQSDGSMTRRHGGLGLGLAIVRQLVELHGGSVAVDSAGSGQGSTFIVCLPLLPVRRDSTGELERVHPAAQINSLPDCPPELAQLRVLLVDDETDSRDIINLMLDSCGAKVTAVNSAAEALKIIEREQFDVIISDIGMPGENGFTLMSKIRNLPGANQNVPAIALTAYARAEDRVRALRSGFQLHIAKPVDPSELIVAAASLAKRIQPIGK